MPKSVNEVFRDFTRWTGDGLPNEPTGHPLPIGDPRSGLWNPPKHDIRDALGGVFDAADRAEDARDAAADYAATATGTPQFSARATAEAATIPAYANTIFVEGQAYRLDPAGTDLVTAGGARWTRVQVYDEFPSEFTRSTDPAVLRAAIGLNGERDAIVGNTGVSTLDAAKFLPNSTVFGGNATADYVLDVSGAIVGQTYAIYNLASVGGRVTLDCGAEYGFMGDGVTPNNLTTTTVTIEGGQVAYISRPNLTRVHIWVQGDYWVSYGTASRYRRCTDGTFEFQHRLGATIAANTLSAVQSLPAGFTLANAIVLGCTTQPKVDGATAPASPCYVELMGTANGLAANEFRLRNPNGASFTHNSITHLVNVVRA